LIPSDDAHGPAGETPWDAAVIVDPMGDEFRFAAENPVSSVAVHDAEGLVEPALLGEDADELLQDVRRDFARGPRERFVFHLLIPPSTGYVRRIHSKAELKPKKSVLKCLGFFRSHAQKKWLCRQPRCWCRGTMHRVPTASMKAIFFTDMIALIKWKAPKQNFEILNANGARGGTRHPF